MSYFLGVLGKGITEIKPLSDKEYQDYHKASNCLTAFSSDQQLYAILLLNYDDFLSTIAKYSQEYAENPQSLNFIVMERMVLNINRQILNYLSSFKSFLDHTETNLRKNYGDKSERYKRFKAVCKEVYDTSFSYRFLSKLRNYGQHYRMPLGELSLNSKEEPPYSGKIYHSVQANFNRDLLLKWDSWGATSKEISKLPSQFDIVPHFVQMTECIKRINLALIDEDLPDLFKSVETIEQLISPAQGKEGTPCILKFLEIKRGPNQQVENLKVQITHIPWHIMEIVNNIKKEKNLEERRGV